MGDLNVLLVPPDVKLVPLLVLQDVLNVSIKTMLKIPNVLVKLTDMFSMLLHQNVPPNLNLHHHLITLQAAMPAIPLNHLTQATTPAQPLLPQPQQLQQPLLQSLPPPTLQPVQQFYSKLLSASFSLSSLCPFSDDICTIIL